MFYNIFVSAEVPALVIIVAMPATGVFTAGVASIGLDMLLFFVWANPIAGDSGVVVKGCVAAVAGGTLWQANLATPIPPFIIGTVFWVAAEVASRVSLGIVVIIADSMTELCFVNSLTSGAHWISCISITVKSIV